MYVERPKERIDNIGGGGGVEFRGGGGGGRSSPQSPVSMTGVFNWC